MSWNQTNESILLKVYLKNVLSADIKCEKNLISFRTTIEKILYGFDLTLYAEIDEKRIEIEPAREYYDVKILKKYAGFWPRLLSTLCKVSFFLLRELKRLKSN